MSKQSCFNKTDLNSILTDLNYYEHFRKNYLNKQYGKINYGKKSGEKSFYGLFDAAEQSISYISPSKKPDDVHKNWNKILNDEKSTEEDFFCSVLEIFVWGGVLNGNVNRAIELYKAKELGTYIKQVAKLLKKKETISKEDIEKNIVPKLFWSSGWTKVYSFIDNEILIYDSRVSAFLNHTLTYNINYNPAQLEKLKILTKHLFNFEGVEGRERLVKKEFGFKNSSPYGIDGLNANLIASWIIELLKEKLNLEQELRLFERAFFMLGFDLKQIKE